MFSNLKSLFFVTEETPAQETDVSTNNTPPNSSTVTDSKKTEHTSVPVSQNPSAEVDKSILDKLLKALEDNNQTGFDYFEYKLSLKSLEKLPMDEATKYQSAFATAATMQVTLEKLLSSIEFYKKVLSVEEENFMKASSEQFSLNVEQKHADIEKIGNLIKEKSMKIQQLTEEIREHQKTQEEMTTFIGTAEAKIKSTESNFKQAIMQLLSQMNDDSNKLKQYIK